MSVMKAKQYSNSGQFEAESMPSKISAAVYFIRRGGKRVIISAIDSVPNTLNDITGTVITP